MKEIIKKILEKIEESKIEELAILDSERGINIKIDKNKFESFPETKTRKNLVFVDGGSLEIIKTPSVSLFFNRIYYTNYSKNKRQENKIFEFYTLITAKSEAEKIVFKTETFFIKNKLNLKEHFFDSFDRKLIQGNRRAEISIVGNILRRLAEIETINEINKTYAESIIILDGSLEAVYPYEEELLEEIVKNTQNTICGLSKTTTLFTSGGKTLTAHLSSQTEKEKWIYEFAKRHEKTHNADIFFLKTHPKSNYIFRIDINNQKPYNKEEIFSLIEENSKDPVFLGYPFGLVEADRFARVSHKEKEALELQIKILFGKEYEKLKKHMLTKNAHEILDSIS